MTDTTTHSRIGSLSIFVGDDANINAALDLHSAFSTDLYIRDLNHDPLVSLHLSPAAVRELQATCDRAIKSVEFEEAKAEASA